jgi:hypothetical protein
MLSAGPLEVGALDGSVPQSSTAAPATPQNCMPAKAGATHGAQSSGRKRWRAITLAKQGVCRE